jgi:hypothetical protein
MKESDDPQKKKPEEFDLSKLQYPAGEDVYQTDEILPLEEKEVPNEDSEMYGSDLDVPGAELDDEEEKIGSEDEENNYYSLGGDNHDDLEDEDNS